jgi:hypothetical protein
MKILIISLTIFLAFFQAEAVAKKKPAVDPKDAKIDSLQKANKSLSLKLDSVTLQLDSTSAELIKYTGVYNAIKEKVIHYNFDPTKTSYLIDSLKASKDSSAVILLSEPKPVVDSSKIAEEKRSAAISASELETARIISSLKQLKDLLDAKIITDAEFLAMKKKYLEKL